MKGLLLLALFAWPALGVAQATGSATISCDPPTLNTDGSPLTNLAGIRFYRSSTSGGPYTEQRDAPSCHYVWEGLAAGTHYFVATAYNLAGVESVYSNQAAKTILDETLPAPPQNLSVDPATLTAYGLQQTTDVLRVFPVGTVPAGTMCDGSMSVNGYYRVPLAAVTWAGTVRPRVVFAACGNF